MLPKEYMIKHIESMKATREPIYQTYSRNSVTSLQILKEHNYKICRIIDILIMKLV